MDYNAFNNTYALRGEELTLHGKLLLPMTTSIVAIPELRTIVTQVAYSLNLAPTGIYLADNSILFAPQLRQQNAFVELDNYTVLLEVRAQTRENTTSVFGITRDERSGMCLCTASDDYGATCMVVSMLTLILSGRITDNMMEYEMIPSNSGHVMRRPKTIRIDGDLFGALPLVAIAHQVFGPFPPVGYKRLMEITGSLHGAIVNNIQTFEQFDLAAAKYDLAKKYVALRDIVNKKLGASTQRRNMDLTEQEIRYHVSLFSHSAVKIDFTEEDASYYREAARQVRDIGVIWSKSKIPPFDSVAQMAKTIGYQGTSSDEDVARIITAAQFLAGIDNMCDAYATGVPADDILA